MGARVVISNESSKIETSNTAIVAFLVLMICLQSCRDSLAPVSVCVMPAATATSSIDPVRMPPI